MWTGTLFNTCNTKLFTLFLRVNMDGKIFLSRRKIIILGLFMFFVISGFVAGYFLMSLHRNFYYPPSSYSEAGLASGLSCESIVSSVLTVNKGENKTIEAEILKGTDKIAVRLKDKKLYFLTSAAVGAGSTEGDALQVIQDNSKYLAAYGEYPYGGMDSFVLNKETGKAIWSKSQPNYLIANDVENQSFLLNCH